MPIQIITGHDATHENISHLPAGLACGYTTGSPAVRWTAADWTAHPGAIRICQDHQASDETADILDVESGAATLADCPVWATAAAASYTDATRPGQRWPAIYMSASQVTNVVNALKTGGVDSGVGLWVANWNLTESQAVQDVQDAAGPFPVIGVQWTNSPGFYDDDVFDKDWVQTVSAAPVASGAVRNISNGTVSLHHVAEHEKVTVEHLGRLAAAHLAPAELAGMVRYLSTGNWGILNGSGARRVMPSGLVFYSTQKR